jgi:fatty-acyl-CoA synthase
MMLLRDALARNATLYGDDPAVWFRGEATTWAELRDRVHRLANQLRGAGVGRGDRVSIHQGNGPEIGEVAFAAALLGATVVPVSIRLTPAEAAWVHEDAEVSVAFLGADREAGAAGPVEIVIATDAAEYEDFVAAGNPAEPPSEESPDDVVIQLYTSGTTGRPKGVQLTQSAMLWNGLATIQSQGVRHGDVFLTATPLTHAAAATRVFSLAIDGLTNVILERFDSAEFLVAIDRYRVTTTIVVPAILRALIDEPTLAEHDLGTLKSIIYGAAPSPRPLIEEVLERLPCRLMHAYGLTEGCPALTALYDHEIRAGLFESVGRSVAGVALRVGTVEEEVPIGEPGELLVRSPKNMVGYWNRPEATAEALRGGWLHTGDVARIDERGYVYIVDRIKDLLISGGFNVYPSEIERVLHEAEEVAEAAVVGVADERWGEVPVAFVVAAAGGEEERSATALRERCTRELSDYKRPKEIVFLAAMPRTETGKIAKPELLRLWGEREGARNGG